MRRGLTVLVACLFLSSVSAAAPPPLDRIMAVFDKGVITLSEIRGRARPHLHQLMEKSHGKAPDQAAIDRLYAELLEQIINERIVASHMESHHLATTNEEIDKGIESIASGNKITTDALYAEVERVGMTRAEYREEVRRQILDGKFVMLYVRPKVGVDRNDEKAYLKAVEELRAKEIGRLRSAHYIEVRK